MDLRYVLYDSLLTTAAKQDVLLFQVAQGADATHTESFTNMRGAGSLPAQESFTIQKIGVIVPPTIVAADFLAYFMNAFVQIRARDQVVAWVPLPLCLIASSWNGFSNLAAAGGLSAIGNLRDGFDLLDLPLVISGGEKFAARVVLNTAPTVVATLIIALIGKLTIGG